LSQNVVHSDSDLILHNSSVLIDKEPLFKQHVFHNQVSNYLLGSSSSNSFLKYLRSSSGSASVSSGS
ncbi:hypothetical protein EWI08_14935, partial [Enterococcus faecium]